jgi:H+/Cl- antiporter ClcA
MGPAPTVRLAGVIAPSALVLHELRYLIGFGHHAHEALAERGHSYLPLAGGVAGLLLALAAAQLIVALDRARRTARAEEPPGLVQIWLVLALALAVVYTGQELLEAALTSGRDVSAAAVLADGGWSALPLALAIGALAALLVHGAGRRVAMVARRARPRAGRPAPLTPRRRVAPVLVRPPVIARHLAGRAPPAPHPAR